ncbi:MAG: hypothetical protein RJA81_1695, partial [Planctomycetota bacterium]
TIRVAQFEITGYKNITCRAGKVSRLTGLITLTPYIGVVKPVLTSLLRSIVDV